MKIDLKNSIEDIKKIAFIEKNNQNKEFINKIDTNLIEFYNICNSNSKKDENIMKTLVNFVTLFGLNFLLF